jgi:tagaturonate reductase
MIPNALLCGVETVGDCMKDADIRSFLEACLGEILATLDFDPAEAKAYADEVLTRFENPYIRHLCSAISLNSVSKFRVRVLPSILAYREKFGIHPTALTYSFKRLIDFYQKGTPRDEAEVIEKMQRELPDVLADTALWGEDLSAMTDAVESANWSRV